LFWGDPAQGHVWAFVIVIPDPFCRDVLIFGDGIETIRREPLVSYRFIKSLNVSVLLRLSGRIYSTRIPSRFAHSVIAALKHSEPLSRRESFGVPHY
jgi:hypothetical protein